MNRRDWFYLQMRKLIDDRYETKAHWTEVDRAVQEWVDTLTGQEEWSDGLMEPSAEDILTATGQAWQKR